MVYYTKLDKQRAGWRCRAA